MVQLNEKEQDALIQTAHRMADAARAAILPLFRTAKLGTTNKAQDGFDPVTLADKASERAIRAILAAERPNDAIMGEEEGNVSGTTGLTWVLDPIDGTRAFVSGTPTWGVLIALSDQNGPLLGVIDQPYIGERFLGGFGRAKMTGPLGTRDLCVSTTTRLSDAVIFTTFPEVGTPAEGAAFHRVARQCKLTRYGMDCYSYALLAAGHVDLVIEAGLHAYDIQGPIGVIHASGGIVTDWQGGPAHNGGTALAAATPELHAAALDILNASD